MNASAHTENPARTGRRPRVAVPSIATGVLITVVLLAPGVLAGRAATQPATASLTVRIDAPGATVGEIGCALYASADGFPLDGARAAARQTHPAASSVTCRSEGLAPGTYAVAVSHDANRNGKTDRNLLGMPREAWGVSNGARPSMGAPRFDEAAVTVAGATGIRIEVTR